MPGEYLLIVEDEKKIAELLRDYLTDAGFRVSCLERGDQVIQSVKENPPALVLLDIMLPGLNGLEVCREIRQFSNVPIIMITARVEEIDRLLGLELGADDYICKPFSPREAVARARAVLRRTYSRSEEHNLVVGPISINEETHQVLIGSQELKLTPSEFGLLNTMMAHPNRVFTRSELISKVQGYDFEGYDRTIDTHIKNLRKKIAEQLPDLEVIRAVYGVGYKFDMKPNE